MLTRSQLRDQMCGAYGSWYWRQPGRFAHNPGPEGQGERVFFILKYRALRAAYKAGRFADEINARGNVILRGPDADRALGFRGDDRYTYDYRLRDWHKMDTWQDAHYFGVWFNDETRQTFTYAEGDRTLVNCPTDASYAAEIADMIAFYRRDRAQ